ncbi:MAG: hypothetical protein J7L34_02160 [Thermotogaceae bacterium]|nr:hypothetical protein [Thermotogaceae bacterium]
MSFWFLKFLKKKERPEEKRNEIKKRLQTVVESRRKEIEEYKFAIPVERFNKDPEEIRRNIIRWAVETFNVDKRRIKVELQEKENQVIIITNVSLR